MSAGEFLVLAGLVLAMVPLLLQPISEALMLLKRRTTGRADSEVGGTPRLLFLVPAHNEELLVGGCVRSVLEMDYPAGALGVVVIADNCSDDTAGVARAAGAECMERFEPELPGKPHALAWAIREELLDGWDACIVLDADSFVDSDYASSLAAWSPLGDRVVQTRFGISNEEESWLTRLAGVLNRVRYDLSYPLKQSSDLNCPLTGNGMCFGSNLLAREGWRGFGLTENWELYASHTERGTRIDYAAAARLQSQEARSLDQAANQRQRWMAGRLAVLAKYAIPILGSTRCGWHQKLDAIAELMSPSPALHVAAAAVLAAVSLLLPVWAKAAALALLIGSLVPLTIGTAVVLVRQPTPWRTLAAFFALPWYVIWRLVLAARTLVMLRRLEWKRTARH